MEVTCFSNLTEAFRTVAVDIPLVTNSTQLAAIIAYVIAPRTNWVSNVRTLHIRNTTAVPPVTIEHVNSKRSFLSMFALCVCLFSIDLLLFRAFDGTSLSFGFVFGSASRRRISRKPLDRWFAVISPHHRKADKNEHYASYQKNNIAFVIGYICVSPSL